MLLDQDADTGDAIEPNATYRYVPEKGPVNTNQRLDNGEYSPEISGRALLCMANDRYDDSATLKEAKMLMRVLLDRRLDSRDLQSRRVYRELMEL